MTWIDFPRKGGRAHVRATDVLAEVTARFPDRPLTLRFLRPLTGPALLSCPALPGASVTGRAGDVRFSLSPAPDASPRLCPAERLPALRLGFGGWHLFAFPPALPLSARIAAIFDRLHPRQAERFLVRQIALPAGAAATGPVLLARLTVAADRRSAALSLSAPLGRVAEIDFRLTPRA